MFVRLEMGWMAHPFPANNFRIESQQQIATLRSLGLSTVRWDPALSDVGALDAASKAAPAAPEPNRGGRANSAPVTHPGELQAIWNADPPAEVLESPKAPDRLLLQRATLAACERQLHQAADACRLALGRVASEPEQARKDIQTLSNSLLSQMLNEEDLCVRLVRDGVGSSSSTHALNVAVLAMLLGRRFGCSATELGELGMGALLHDIGKIGMAQRLHHPDPFFTAAERRGYEEHVEFGLQRGRQMGLPPSVLQIIAQHHEMLDASGFPGRLGSERMSDAARIVSLVNAYDTLSNSQINKTALTPHEALAQMFTYGKKRFDETLLSAFIKLVGVYPAGTTVQLTDERFAVVVAVDAARPLKPRVLVHDAAVAREDALVVDIGEHPGLGIRRTVKPAHLPDAALRYLTPRHRVGVFFEPAAMAHPG